jgi:hypothetical protein
MAADHLSEVKQLFDLYDSDADNSLSLNELTMLLIEIGSKITSLPATAQVAAQQGKYIGKKLHKLARQKDVLEANALATDTGTADELVAKPFKYLHLGSLAYIGNAAVFDLGGHSFMGGLVAMYAWRSVYWNEQVSLRTRALLMIDWVIRYVAHATRFTCQLEKLIEKIVGAYGAATCPGSERRCFQKMRAPLALHVHVIQGCVEYIETDGQTDGRYSTSTLWRLMSAKIILITLTTRRNR